MKKEWKHGARSTSGVERHLNSVARRGDKGGRSARQATRIRPATHEHGTGRRDVALISWVRC